MAFETSIQPLGCPYRYTISPNIKRYTLRDTTFMQTKLGNYELTRLLEKVPNSGDGFQLKIIVNKALTGFKLTITDKSGLHLINIFKSEDNKMIQDKFYFLMDSLIERDIFIKETL